MLMADHIPVHASLQRPSKRNSLSTMNLFFCLSFPGTAGWAELYETFARHGLSLSVVLECLNPEAISEDLVKYNILTSAEWRTIVRKASKGKARPSWFLLDKVARKRMKYKERLASLVTRTDSQFVEQSKINWAGPQRTS